MKTNRFGATILRENFSKEILAIYKKFPEYHGKSPNFLINKAWDLFVNNLLKNKNLNKAVSKSKGKCKDIASHYAPKVSRLINERAISIGCTA